jgi:hypothetical protein
MNNVVLFLYNGHKPSAAAIEQMANILANTGIAFPESIECKHFDSDSIAKAIVRTIRPEEEKTKPDSEIFGLEQSCIYMAERFKAHIRKSGKTDTGSYVSFMFALRDAYEDAHAEPYAPTSIAFMNAMRIIYENERYITTEMRKRTGITNIATRIICKFYEANQ